jgi:hypothetical protein
MTSLAGRFETCTALNRARRAVASPDPSEDVSSGIYFPRTYSSRAPHLNASIDSKPQYYQRRTLKMDPKESAIQSAIADYNSGVFTSLRKAAEWYGIAESTLRGRRRGQQPHAIAHQQQQRLTPEQEAFLVDWILDEDSRAQPPSHLRVREMATRILHMNGDHEPLGQLWVPHFITRNPRVASVVGRTIKSARTTGANYKTVRAFLELFERTRIELGIQYEDMWNMDETGVALGRIVSGCQLLRPAQPPASSFNA